MAQGAPATGAPAPPAPTLPPLGMVSINALTSLDQPGGILISLLDRTQNEFLVPVELVEAFIQRLVFAHNVCKNAEAIRRGGRVSIKLERVEPPPPQPGKAA